MTTGGFKSVGRGACHSCGVKQLDGTLWCWGEVIGSYSPTQIGTDTDWTSVLVNSKGTCAIKSDQTVWCSHYSTCQSTFTAPIADGGGYSWISLDVNNDEVIGVKDDGTLWTWEIGSSPQQVGSGSNWLFAVNSVDHQCAIQTNGTLWCWGNNFFGQLGIGTEDSKTSPTQVGSATDWERVSADEDITCGIELYIAMAPSHVVRFTGPFN